MGRIFCKTCGKEIADDKIKKAKKQNRIAKYCSTTCWGKRPRVHAYDHTFLDTNTELAAYFAGWWTADGHIDKKHKMIHITTVDKQLLDAFISRVHYNKIIHIRPPKTENHKIQYTIRLAGNISKRIQEMGYALGAKGGKELFPARFYNEQFFYHFVRGFFDGDGTIHKTDRGSITLSIVNLSYKLLFDIHSWLYNRKIVRGGAIYEPRPAFYKLQFGHFDTVQLCQHMYANATICLERKHQKYLEGKDFVQGCIPQTNTVCSVPSCQQPSRTNGLCKQHYDMTYRIEYYETHKEEIYEKDRKWKAVNRDKILEQRRQAYAKDPEKYRETSYRWRKENPEKVKEAKKQYDASHRDEINAYKREVRKRDHEKIREQEKASYYRNRPQKLEARKRYNEAHKEEIALQHKEYREKNKEKLSDYFHQNYLKKREKILARRKQRYQQQKEADSQ